MRVENPEARPRMQVPFLLVHSGGYGGEARRRDGRQAVAPPAQRVVQSGMTPDDISALKALLERIATALENIARSVAESASRPPPIQGQRGG